MRRPMVLDQQHPVKKARKPGSSRDPERPPTTDPGSPTRADALGRIASKVSGRRDVEGLFNDVIDEAFGLFGVDRAGLWLYDRSASTPLSLGAHRGLSAEIIEAISSLPSDAPTTGMDALRRGRVRVLDRAMRTTTPELRAVYRSIGVRAVCYVPLVFGEEPLGLLVLYHREAYAWTSDERALARAFGDQMATAIGGARLAESRRTLADRLTSIAELTGRLSQLDDQEAIAWAIVAEAKRLTQHDTIRVYRVDHAIGMCEPLAFEGTLFGTTSPPFESLRIAVGEGLTGWVAKHGLPVRLGDAARDPRGLIVGNTDEPESMLIVPMLQKDVVHGVIVVTALGRDRFDADDEVTLTIFAAAAVQAFVNAENVRAPARAASRAGAPAGGPASPARRQRAPPLDARAGRRARPDRRLAQGDRAVRLADGVPRRPRRGRPAGGHRPRSLRRRDPRPREPARTRHHRLGHRPR